MASDGRQTSSNVLVELCGNLWCIIALDETRIGLGCALMNPSRTRQEPVTYHEKEERRERGEARR